jgi:hypothetical protein
VLHSKVEINIVATFCFCLSVSCPWFVFFIFEISLLSFLDNHLPFDYFPTSSNLSSFLQPEQLDFDYSFGFFNFFLVSICSFWLCSFERPLGWHVKLLFLSYNSKVLPYLFISTFCLVLSWSRLFSWWDVSAVWGFFY